MTVMNADPEMAYFSDFTVQSNAAQPYQVEIRSLTEHLNSCSCADYDTNGLGTCKHVEKVLLALEKKGKRPFKEAGKRGSERIEIYVDSADDSIKLQWPQGEASLFEQYHFLKDFFSVSGHWVTDSNADARTVLPLLLRQLDQVPEKDKIRVSRKVQMVLAALPSFAQKNEMRALFLSEVDAGKHTLDVTKLPLYDYQKQGMLHLAFLEKAILADEMGLGKTVQAIAAALLLHTTRGVRKVLVVAPTSLKAEWEEQISKFSHLPSLLIYGNRAERLRQYSQEAFFYVSNYEQVVRDLEDIQRLLSPDIVILDEAQRIKNWRTKTAATIKQLKSPYAFVLTGTPIENRIDDIYSLVQFLYPKLFGALFRFNRDFYQLDDAGKPTGYKNLHLLHERLRPILLRRLKKDVEGQLPNRTINTYFVPMSLEQQRRSDEYKSIVTRLSAAAARRPLSEDEFRKLQMALASMRMLCDTPYILDEDCRICPKLEELETILEELFQNPAVKIIIFSEWERMLMLVQGLLGTMNVKSAWHTGSVDQRKRKDEINRFKEAPCCKVLLSTDCGAVGLNLQVANVVINLDLPWNPARLEQRIARAWRKHQTRAVQVINLVAENTIEHRMLWVLNVKQRLAESVLDLGTIETVEMPSGRKAFMEQLQEMMRFSSRPSTELSEKAHLEEEELEVSIDEEGERTLSIVGEGVEETFVHAPERVYTEKTGPQNTSEETKHSGKEPSSREKGGWRFLSGLGSFMKKLFSR